MRACECKTLMLYLMRLSSFHPPEARTKPHPQPEHLSSMQVPWGVPRSPPLPPQPTEQLQTGLSCPPLVAGCPFPSLSAPPFPPALGSLWGGAYGVSLAIRQEVQEAKRGPREHPGDTTDGLHRLVRGPERVESGPLQGAGAYGGCWFSSPSPGINRSPLLSLGTPLPCGKNFIMGNFRRPEKQRELFITVSVLYPVGRFQQLS